MEQNTETSLFELQIDHQSSAYLGEAARWAKFFAILGFIGCGLMIVIGLFAGTIFTMMFSRMNVPGTATGFVGGLFSFIYIVVALVMFFPCLYLYNFGSKMQVALRSNDQVQLAQSFRNLKSHYRFIGILTLIYLGLMTLALLLGVLGSAFR